MIFLYLDPGSGSMLVQAAIAGALGVVMFFKRIKLQIQSFFNSKTDDDTNGDK